MAKGKSRLSWDFSGKGSAQCTLTVDNNPAEVVAATGEKILVGDDNDVFYVKLVVHFGDGKESTWNGKVQAGKDCSLSLSGLGIVPDGVDDASGLPSNFDPRGGTISPTDGSVLLAVEGFQISKYDVTNAQYARFVKVSGYQSGTEWIRYSQAWGPRAPVVCVSWDDAQAYCKWAGLRLPTGQEWQRAAQGPHGRDYPWGNDPPDAERAVWNSDRPREVGSRPAGISGSGCLDMAGNVCQWTSDDAEPELSGTYQINKGSKVLRGGSWMNDDPCYLQCSYNVSFPHGDRYNFLGFRCARTP